MKRIFTTLATFLLAGHALAFSVPPYAGFVTDRVGILSSDEQQQLEDALTMYRAETSNEIAILVVNTLDGETIADVAVEVGREWGIGTGEFDNGILLLIAIDDREMFLATGYGLEGAVPDLIAKQIIDDEIAPYFRDEDYFEGLMAGVDALKKVIGGEYKADESSSGSVDVDFFGLFVFFVFFIFPWLGAIFGRTKSWWLGGVVGGVAGIVLWIIFSFIFAIPVLVLIGLLLDFLVSKNYKSNRKNSWWSGGNWGPGGFGGRGGSSGGGFGGFSGGSFGGGGAGGKW